LVFLLYVLLLRMEIIIWDLVWEIKGVVTGGRFLEGMLGAGGLVISGQGLVIGARLIAASLP